MSLIDLHVCKNSIKSGGQSSSVTCECPPEYYCYDYCGEAGSISTLISWQHFPRSTSSRSRCDESSEEPGAATVSESKTPSVREEEKESVQVSSTEYPITKSFSELQALHYLEIRYVFHFFNFLMSHLVCNEPQDPIQFLVDLLDKCLKFRDRFGEPPLLFTRSHVQSLYNAFDPFERGYLTVEQYHRGMKALGLINGPTGYNRRPPVNEEGFVGQSDFIFEANNRLINNLRLMVRIPKEWEENRLVWKKKMEKKKKLRGAKTVEAEENGECEEEEDVGPRESPPLIKTKIIRESPHSPNRTKMKCEPVQLFLN